MLEFQKQDRLKFEKPEGFKSYMLLYCFKTREILFRCTREAFLHLWI